MMCEFINQVQKYYNHIYLIVYCSKSRYNINMIPIPTPPTLLIPRRHFDMDITFNCGQAFRWRKQDSGYIGVVGDHAVICRYDDGNVAITGGEPSQVAHYFDAAADYDAIVASICTSRDPWLMQAVQSGMGLRILRQPHWETLCSFIISACNNIKRISGIIDRLCLTFGKPAVALNSGITGHLHTFPTPQTLAGLTELDLAPIRCGFRAKYLIDAANKVASEQINLEALQELTTTEARKVLTQINGVGEKVADCVLLFSYNRLEAFPKDVWITRVMRERYGVERRDTDAFALQRFGEYCGVAQQFLFHDARSKTQ